MIGCLTKTTTCVVAKPLVNIKEINFFQIRWEIITFDENSQKENHFFSKVSENSNILNKFQIGDKNSYEKK